MSVKTLLLTIVLAVFFSFSAFAIETANNGSAVQHAYVLRHGSIPQIIAQQEPQPQKSQMVAFALALLGLLALPIGLHRLYLGYKGDFILMLILTLTVVGAIVTWIWTLIDLVKILDGSLKPADGSPYKDTI